MISTWYFKPRSTAHGRINTGTAQPYLVHFKIITVSAIPNRTFSLHNSMSLSGNWFMKVTWMPGVAIIALIHQCVYTQFGGPHFLLIYLIRQKKRVSFQSSSFLLTNCIINRKFSKEYTKVIGVDTCTKIQIDVLQKTFRQNYSQVGRSMRTTRKPLLNYSGRARV